MLINVLTEVRRTEYEQSKNFNRDRKCKESHTGVTEVKTTTTELENSTKGFSSR